MNPTMPVENEPAEQMVLGAMMIDEGCADHGLSLLRKPDFHRHVNQVVYEAIAHLRSQGRAAGPDMVFIRLTEAKQVRDFGEGDGAAAIYLARLYQTVVTGAYLDYSASKVRDCSIRRQIIHQATQSIRDATDGVNPGEELAAEAAEAMARISQPLDRRGPQLLSALIHRAMTRYDNQIAGKMASRFYRTGFESFDAMTGGISVGSLTILAARPSVGKSALALRWTEVIATQVGVLFLSMEMDNDETIDRYIAGATKIHLARLRGQRPFDDFQIAELATFPSTPWASLPIFIDDTPRQTLSRIVAIIRTHVSKYKIGAVVVDYLGLIAFDRDDARLPTHEKLGMCTRMLKALASDLGIAMILLAQLNRGAEDRGPDVAPRLSDLKGSGDIEQDGDNIFFLHRPPFEESSPVIPIDLVIAKQRNGPIGTTTIQYIRPIVRFEENMPNL
jgi:replicative DNA helicase